METHAYHLQFNEPLHIGVEGIGQECIETEIGSDTLWGALAQCWALLFDESIDELAKKSPFQLSSAFPYQGQSRYYPVPVHFLDLVAGDASAQGWDFKPLKKIRYLCEDLFLSLAEGNSDLATLLLEDKGHWPSMKKEQEFSFWEILQRPRLRIDRLTGGSEEGGFFYCSDLYFHPGCGLYFLARFQPEVKERFEAALRLLGDQGLGADRSIGRGQFRFSVETVNLPEPKGDELRLLLSTCYPSSEDIARGIFSASQVRLKVRRGHAGAPGVHRLRRPDMLTLGEGSLITSCITGCIPTLIEKGGIAPHNVYRNGRAFTVPFIGSQGG